MNIYREILLVAVLYACELGVVVVVVVGFPQGKLLDAKIAYTH